MHKMIRQITLHCPPYFRSQNPDTTFDSHPDCYWLPKSRPLFQNGTAFTIMALHRPYIFTSNSSRTAALKAGLEILRAQRAYFNMLNSTHYKMFSLVLSTFDAIVLVAAIYILYPTENKEDLDDTLQHFEWGMERFATMGDRNTMANDGLGVLKAIYSRLKRALSRAKMAEASSVASSHQSPLAATPESSLQAYPTPSTNPSISSASTNSSSSISNTTSQYTLPTISNLTEATPVSPATWEAFSAPAVSMPNTDFSNIAPLMPMHDLLFNDLGTVNGGLDLNHGSGLDLQNRSSAWLNNTNNVPQWQFEGDFGNDSFWEFMNTYNP